MSPVEKSRLGGLATAATHTHAYYVGLGVKGGSATYDRYGREFYERMGRRSQQFRSRKAQRAAMAMCRASSSVRHIHQPAPITAYDWDAYRYGEER